MRGLSWIGQFPVLREFFSVFHEVWALLEPVAWILVTLLVGALVARLAHAAVIRTGRWTRLDVWLGDVPLEQFSSPSAGLARLVQVVILVIALFTGLKLSGLNVADRALELTNLGLEFALVLAGSLLLATFVGLLLGNLLAYLWALCGREGGSLVRNLTLWTVLVGVTYELLGDLLGVSDPYLPFLWSGWALAIGLMLLYRPRWEVTD